MASLHPYKEKYTCGQPLDTATGVIWSVGQVYNALHIPLGILADTGQ